MKLNQHNPDHLITTARYFAGEMSPEELRVFEEHAESDADNKLFISMMRNDWDRIGNYRKTKEVDSDSAWSKLHNRLSGENLIPEKKAERLLVTPHLLKWAAIGLILLSFGSVTFYFANRTPANQISVQTSNDEGTLVETLSDGSVVYLSKNTSLSYPEVFEKGQRKVKLNGEAFFDVAPNAAKPFIIETDLALIEVLGTSFNVQTSTSNTLELIVERGRVRVTLKSDKKQSQLVEGGQRIIAQGNALIKSFHTNTSYALWRRDKMRFKDETLDNIIRVINSNYGSSIQLKGDRLGERRLTVTFSNISITNITELICVTLNLRYEVNADSTITIMPTEQR